MEFEHNKNETEIISETTGETSVEEAPERTPAAASGQAPEQVAEEIVALEETIAANEAIAIPEAPRQPEPPSTPARSRSGRGLLSYLMVGLVGAIIGGFLVIGIAPQVLLTRAGLMSTPGRIQMTTPSTQTPTVPLTFDGDPWQKVAAVAEKVSPAVVGIVNKQGGVYDFFGREYVTDSSGSGLIITSDGFIVTNYHVVEGQKGLIVYLADGRELPAEVVGTDPKTDLAVIKIGATNLTTGTFGNSDQLKVGELAVAIGNPLGMDFSRTVTSGVVSGLNRVVDISQEAAVRLIQTDAVINPGNSGGPLVNANGEVIGINSLKLVTSQVEGMGFAIPSTIVTRVANEIMATGTVRRAQIGVTLADASLVAREREVPIARGAYVESVIGAPARTAGLKEGDVIVALDDVTVNTVSTLRALLAEKSPGDKVKVKVVRGKQDLTLEVTLGAATQ